MINITLDNFEAEVITASHTTPILLDFWAPWCGPCKVIGPLLERIENEYEGRFLLAKIDSDQEQQISAMFGIRSIPTVILMVNGQPVDGFQGALPEGQIKAFLDKHLPAPELPTPEPEIDPTQAALDSGDTAAALTALANALATDPTNDQTRFDYIKLLLQEHHNDDAKVAFAPVIANSANNPKWTALQAWFAALDNPALNGDSPEALFIQLDSQIASNKRDFASRFHRAQLLMKAQRWTDAMDELLEILMRDKEWNGGQARKTYIAILEIIAPPKPKVEQGHIPPEDPVLASYRRRLSSVVLS